MQRNIDIGYDLHLEKNYPRIIKGIHSLGVATRILASHWRVATTLTCDEVAAYLRNFVDEDDVFYVAEVSKSVISGTPRQAPSLGGLFKHSYLVQSGTLPVTPAQYGIGLNRLAALQAPTEPHSAQAAAGLLGSWK
ncbi:hypothetical protein [Herbaspirillum seropedicae]|uniref:hypothetical protein n=1 Tax=Herbaspirillum seropedicae TaxID=964 RepID=UPI000848038A|nr:hypothetical protein [Herbaspirillum seropedicae]AON54691.1 hypothetical protein Hsc_2406 [Herbaspirillum seropedicae]